MQRRDAAQMPKDAWTPLEDIELARRYIADGSVDSISVFLAVRQLVLLLGQTRWVYVAEGSAFGEGHLAGNGLS
jgi:hypothetical protein